MPFMLGLDPLYLILTVPVFLFSLYAQFKVKSSFEKYSKYRTSANMTGAQIAKLILDKNGIGNVRVERVGGFLSDHYSPSQRVLRLSPKVYDSASISAVGVAAHEAGHALQHAKGYFAMQLRQGLAGPATFASNISIWLIIGGMLLGMLGLAKVGFVLFGVIVLFQIVTLPVEIDASNRAKRFILDNGIVLKNEYRGVKAVLDSAALTYIAAAAASIAQLLYFAIRLGLIGGRD